MRSIIIITLILFISKSGYADIINKLGITSSYIYININDKNFDYINEYETINDINYQYKNISVNYSVFIDNTYSVTLSTNRILDNPINRKVTRKSDNLEFRVTSHSEIDSLNISYNIKKYSVGLLIINANISKYLIYNDNIINYSNKHSILFGTSLGYYLNKDIIISANYIFPNRELDLESGFVISSTYLF